MDVTKLSEPTMVDPRTLTEGRSLDKILAEIQLLKQQREQSNDIVRVASLCVHSRCGNVNLDEMVVSLASESAASRNEMKQPHDTIIPRLQQQLKTLTDTHRVEEEEQEESSIDVSSQMQPEITETDVVMTNIPQSDSKQIDPECESVQSLGQHHESDEKHNLNQSLKTHPMVDATTRTHTDDGVPVESVTKVELLGKQPQPIASDRCGQDNVNVEEMRPARSARLIFRPWESEESMVIIRDPMQLRTADSDTMREQSPINDDVHWKQLTESGPVQSSAEKCSERSDKIARPNVSMDAEQRYESGEVGFVRSGKIDARHITQNLDSITESPNSPHNSQKKTKTYSCGECKRQFNWKSKLTTHSRTHTGERPYACKDCGAAFGFSSHLKTHQRIHTGVKPYVCGDCGTAYSEISTLRNHQKTQTDAKPYKCKDCGAVFNRSGCLKAHKRTHIESRPFICDICRKSFLRKIDLSRHKAVHFDEKPHK